MEANSKDRKIKEFYLKLLNEIEDGYLELDIYGTILFANKAFSKIIGYSIGALEGMDYRSYMDAQSAEKCFNAFNKVFRSGEPEPSFTYEMLRKDNKKRVVEYSISPLKAKYGKCIGFRCIIRDVTEKKRALDQIAKQRALLEATFSSVKDGIVTVDTRGNIIEANRAASDLCNLMLNNIKGKPFQACFSQCSKACHEVLFSTLKIQKTINNFQLKCRQRNRLSQTVKITSSPLINSDRNVIGAVIVIRDVTRLLDLERQICNKNHYNNIIGKSQNMINLFSIIRRLKDVDTTVLITGESGTGKEMVARALHQTGNRAFEPLITVNCAALSETLLESELFGHVKGAFTGAVRDSLGRFELANKGSIFLDEIGEISQKTQVKLLRVLQEKQFERVGDSRSIQTDVRIIAATNQNLKLKIQSGEFRQDLYYRLKVVELKLPPLRERNEDITLLIHHFCEKFKKKYKKPDHILSKDVVGLLLEHDWPGNVRELKHTLERLFVLSGDRGNITQELLPREIAGYGAGHGQSRSASGPIPQEELEKTLVSTDWNISKTARQLGVNRRTVYRWIHKKGLTRPSSM